MKSEPSALPVVLMFSLLAAVLYFAHQKNMDNIGEEGLKTFTASCGQAHFQFKKVFNGSSFVGYFGLDGVEIERIPESCVITSK